MLPLPIGPATQTPPVLAPRLPSAPLFWIQPNFHNHNNHNLLYSFTFLLLQTHATFCVPGTRYHCIFFANNFTSWNCQMTGVEKDFRNIRVQPAGFYDTKTSLAWWEDFSKVSKVRIPDFPFRILCMILKQYFFKNHLQSFTKYFYTHHLVESLLTSKYRYKLKLRKMEGWDSG